MRRVPVRVGLTALAALIVVAATVVAGCGKSEKPVGGSAVVAMSTPPDSLDPQVAYSTEAAEADWIAYTPLLTYRHRSGAEGAELIPGLATGLPRISPEGRRYRFALRKGLAYSNGEPVRATDFEHAIERALHLDWPGERFITENIVGARSYDEGRARQISGITADDVRGKLSIKLIRPNGSFANVLGLPATAPIPSSTPMTDLSAKPPPGVGSYRIADVSPGRRWTMVKNPGFARAQIPDVPVGNLERVTVKVEPDARSAISKVLRGRADGFDPATPLPAGTRSRVRSAAEDRFEFVPIPSTLYFYLNTAAPPFSSELARRAVVTALDRPALARLAKNSIVPECYLIPAGISGHPTDGCPYGGADDTGDRRAGRQLVEESGTEGAPVTISVDANWPQPAYGRYFAKLLTRLGFEAHLEIARTRPPGTGDHAAGDVQAGFASWFNDFPAPADFFAVLDGRAAGGAESPNAGGVQDPFIQQQLEKLSLVPAQESSTSSDDWRDLDEYAAQKAYLAVFATQQVPKLLSDRISFDSAVIHPLFLSDWSSWELR